MTIGGCREVNSAVEVVDTVVVVSAVVITSAELAKPPKALSSGSADSLLVGVSTLGYPSEHADPLDSAFGGLVSSADVMTTADTTSTTVSTTPTAQLTVAEVTAAASRSPTQYRPL